MGFFALCFIVSESIVIIARRSSLLLLSRMHTLVLSNSYDVQDDELLKLWNDLVTGLLSKYKTFKGTKMEEAYVKPTKAKADTIMGVLYLDFETYPQAVGDVAPPIEDGYPEEKSSDPMDIYIPYPFDARQLSTNSTYPQVVNWCEIQHEDKEGIVHTHTFKTISKIHSISSVVPSIKTSLSWLIVVADLIFNSCTSIIFLPMSRFKDI